MAPLTAGVIVRLIYRKTGRDRDKEPDSSAEEDEGVDESENQEEGSLGRHGGHTTRNGLASATLPVRVTSRLSVTRTTFLPFPPPITATTATATHNPFTAATVLRGRRTDLSIFESARFYDISSRILLLESQCIIRYMGDTVHKPIFRKIIQLRGRWPFLSLLSIGKLAYMIYRNFVIFHITVINV